MCGIVGVIHHNAPEGSYRERVKKMMSIIRHRGPDGEGIIELEGGITFGHVRLAILDLSTNANQPMTSVNKFSTIVYNGELYNHNELRADLLQRGFKFKSRSDTEVLLNAYECWGSSFVNKLNGMFAFILQDSRDGSILFGRDRLGIKPLYYYADHEKIYFASEIKAIASVLNNRPSMDTEALREYLVFQNNFNERTLVEGIKIFPAGSIAKITRNSTQISPVRFWEACIVSTNQTPLERQEQLTSVLEESIHSQLQADVPVNSFLSGGIDSSAIAAIATKKSGRIKTFTCGFDLSNVSQAELSFDERCRAELVSAFIGSEHYEVLLKDDDFLAMMSKWAWHAEEPRVGSSFPNYCVSNLASRFTKICLSGAGADELFGGYPWRYKPAHNATSDSDFIDKYFNTWNRMLATDSYKRLLAPLNNSSNCDPYAIFSKKITEKIACASESTQPHADASLLFELETFLHGLLLVEDKTSMAHGLEVRVPFLDNRMIDIALTIPFNEKVQMENTTVNSFEQYGKGSTSMPSFSKGKIILRDVLNRYVPPEIAQGRKQGFSPPVETWFRQKMQRWMSEKVFGNNSPLADYLDMRVAQKLLNEHLSAKANHRLFLWGMISLHLFMTEFLNGLV